MAKIGHIFQIMFTTSAAALKCKDRFNKSEEAFLSICDRYTVLSGVEFSTEENRPAKYPLEDIETFTADEAQQWNEQIDVLIANTNLSCPPNRCSLVHCIS